MKTGGIQSNSMARCLTAIHHAQQLLCLTLNDFTMNFYEYLSDAGRYHPSLHR